MRDHNWDEKEGCTNWISKSLSNSHTSPIFIAEFGQTEDWLYNLFSKKRRIQDETNVSMISDDFINESLNSQIVNIIFSMKCFSCEKTP